MKSNHVKHERSKIILPAASFTYKAMSEIDEDEARERSYNLNPYGPSPMNPGQLYDMQALLVSNPASTSNGNFEDLLIRKALQREQQMRRKMESEPRRIERRYEERTRCSTPLENTVREIRGILENRQKKGPVERKEFTVDDVDPEFQVEFLCTKGVEEYEKYKKDFLAKQVKEDELADQRASVERILNTQPEGLVEEDISARIERFAKRLESHKIKVDNECFSFVFLDHDFPGDLIARINCQEFRPVYIDALAVGYMRDHSFNPTLMYPDVPYAQNRVLAMKPVIDIAVYFLMRGFKTSLFLPRFYENEYHKNDKKKPTVDDIDLYKLLRELNLITFIDFEANQNDNYFVAMKMKVQEVDACFISCPEIEMQYVKAYRNAFNKLGYDAGQFYSGLAEAPPVGADVLKVGHYKGRSTARLLAPMFHGIDGNRFMDLSFQYFVGLEHGDHANRGKFWRTIPACDVTLYTGYDGDQSDCVIRLSNQLRFWDQYEILKQISMRAPLDIVNLRGVQLILCAGTKFKPQYVLQQLSIEDRTEYAPTEETSSLSITASSDEHYQVEHAVMDLSEFLLVEE